ncbi:MAG: MotA/TolQ/ExbB proton channel family protein [Bacteroidia bacterium]|nr:MotA/TolQ/ExbB proton channel family protein [Bacteroidia bacterium]MDW8334482.1 MotA/TolQ/ExbB proton channel family protein [Bacteroidia bacterium]
MKTLFYLTQSDELTSTEALEAALKKPVEITLFDLAWMGGWAMIPLGLLLVVGVYIYLERWMTIRRSNADPEPFIREVRALVLQGDLTRAQSICEKNQTPFARLVAKGIKRLGHPLPDIAAAIENEAKLELARLEKKLGILATIAGAAPMVGFLGTVSGLITAFMTISHMDGNISPKELADGIYQAMITTAAGLIVGIPAYVGYNYLTTLVADVVAKMEITSTEFIDLLQEPVRAHY